MNSSFGLFGSLERESEEALMPITAVLEKKQEAMGIRVLLVDDHTILREALRALLVRETDIKVVADVDRASEALRLAKELAPDVVVMDIGLPGMNGIEATRQLVAASPDVKILALSTYLEHPLIVQMLDAGAGGYVAKSADSEELLRAIRAVAQNRTYLCTEAASVVVNSIRHRVGDRDDIRERLGNREVEVLMRIAVGRTSQEIASELHIAAATVVVHRRNISRKLGLHSVAELTKYAIRAGLTSS